MKKELKEFQKDKEVLKTKFKLWLKDTSISLDEKFDLLCSSELGDTSDRTTFGLGDDDTFLYEEPDATTYYYIGECYEKLEDPKSAFSNYLKVTKLDPFNADAWAGLAVINEADNKTTYG